MKGINRVTLLGNLGQDPELKHTSTGTPICKFSLATNKKFKDAKGNMEERVEWHSVVVWNKLAEIAAEYLQKGGAVYVEGELQTQKWTDDKSIDRWTTQIVARELVLLSGNKTKDGRRPEPDTTEITDDDIPF